MPLIDPADTRPVHFMGVGGAGMSALAVLLARRGVRVTGCDQGAAPADLRRSHIVAKRGHSAAHVKGHRALVVTSAIPKDHPEIRRANALGIPVIRRAEALAEATAGGDRLVAVAGTHGKSTTTAMTTAALKAAGIDATGVVGARIAAWKGNLSPGSDRVFVLEADEYDRSFLALHPDVAVVTNVEADHLDTYRDLDEILATFATFVAGARWLVLCTDDAGANALPTPAGAEVLRYGIDSADARLVARDIVERNGTTTFRVAFDGDDLGPVRLAVPGLHNVRNALAAIGVGLVSWGLPLDRMARGLARFRGAERRFQRLGSARGVTVIDDYAHHPTELRATLSAARRTFGNKRIVAAFQPHLFTRTRDFAAEFASALAAADAVFLADIYPAREKPLRGVTSGLIAAMMQDRGRAPEWSGPRSRLARALARKVRRGDVVLTLGAGDITKTGRELLRALGGTR